MNISWSVCVSCNKRIYEYVSICSDFVRNPRQIDEYSWYPVAMVDAQDIYWALFLRILLFYEISMYYIALTKKLHVNAYDSFFAKL